MRFPKLMGHVACTILPMELAAILARREAAEETGLPPEAIGVFAIVPCSSKVTAARVSEGLSRPVLDGAFAIRDIYLRLLNPMRELEDDPMTSAGILGLGWASCGGESAARLGERCVAVDGIQNVIRMLEEIEDGRLPEADFLELSACTQGCVGGCFNVENPYAAKLRIKGLLKGLPVSRNRFLFHGEARDIVRRDKELQYLPAFVLDQDREMAISKQLRIQELESHLPGLHCGSCGAPSCRAFAEDVVLGRASEDDCIFKVRERMRSMAGSRRRRDDYLPPPFRRQGRPNRPTAAVKRPASHGGLFIQQGGVHDGTRTDRSPLPDPLSSGPARPPGFRRLRRRPAELGAGPGRTGRRLAHHHVQPECGRRGPHG